MKGTSSEDLAKEAQATSAARPMRTRQQTEVPWGQDGSLALVLPETPPFDQACVDVVWPETSSSIGDYAAALEAALESPMDALKLEQLVAPGSTVAVVVDDPSRWTPVREALPILLRRLHAAGVAREDVTICVGVGRHAAVDAHSMRRRLGESIAVGYPCFSPPLDDISAYVELGRTQEGIPVRIFRPVAQASVRILIGSVLPHLQAGFGGGYKLILPGTSHRSTLGALHRQGIDAKSSTTSLLGNQAAGNPMRRAIAAAAQMLGPCWSISHLAGGRGQIFRILAGHPERVQDLLAAEAQRRLEAPPAPPADLVVVGNNPWPGDPMQSFKVLLHHRAACRPCGVLAGLFWTDPDEIDRSFPITMLRRIAATGASGGWTIRWLLPLAERIAGATQSPAAFMLHWARELVVDRTVLVYAPPLHDRIGRRLGPVHIFGDQAALWQAAATAIARSDRGPDRRDSAVEPIRVRIFPQGGLTYVP
jgi:lactate racemase